MINKFKKFEEYLTSENNIIFSLNPKLNQVIQEYSFLYISQQINDDIKQKILANIDKSKIFVINNYKESLHFIVGFKKMVLIINQSQFQFLHQILSSNKDIEIVFLPDTKSIFDENIKIDYKESVNSNNENTFYEEISSFSKNIKMKKNCSFIDIISSIIHCISGYLIKQSYSKLINNRTADLYPNEKIEDFGINDFIFLRIVGTGYILKTELVYHIEKEQLFIIKSPNTQDNEIPKLIERETNNYMKISHQFLPKFYGTVAYNGFNCPVIEFINGQTLLNYYSIENSSFSKEDNAIIFFQLLLVFEYLHSHGFVYRDLKPNNVMIINKTIVLIDFDRMIDISNDKNKVIENSNCENTTKDFNTCYIAPEVSYGEISYKCDIYSIGKMIGFIFNHRKVNLEVKNNDKREYFNGNQELLSMYQQCTSSFPDKRPSISNLMFDFFKIFPIEISNSFVNIFPVVQFFNDIIDCKKNHDIQFIYERIDHFLIAINEKNPFEQYDLGFNYQFGEFTVKDINKSIYYYTLAANQYLIDALFELGNLYYEGEDIPRDVYKAIQFFSIAANLNDSEAQFCIGSIYYEDEYIPQDIEKAIHYFLLASNQNHETAQFYLGMIYYEDGDINKSIHYLLLAANQNQLGAQSYLAKIYYDGEYVTRDINKAIHYFTLAADHNIQAQLDLAEIYYEGKYISRDINKAIHYFTLAADHNIQAQLDLAEIYYEGKYISRDINKAIHYFSLAANKGYPIALCHLGQIYYDGKYIAQDIDKAIHYFIAAGEYGDPISLFYLSQFYSEGKYITKDIDKAIHYFKQSDNKNYSETYYIIVDINQMIYFLSHAAKKNNIIAQYYLGQIYHKGIHIQPDLNKAIAYYLQASKQNHQKSQIALGIIYCFSMHNINKGIHFFLQAAKQKNPRAMFWIGFLYFQGKGVARDINKAIHYLLLAANENNELGLFFLGKIYYEGKYVKRDINKAIHFFSLSADQNYPDAQYYLGLIYYENEYVPPDIEKAIHYFSLAADQDNADAQIYLGIIYYKNEYFPRDIDKAIHYFSLAADQNNVNAQINLGFIYFTGEYVTQDINKAAHYFTLAANQNDKLAQFFLGVINSDFAKDESDFNKAVYYFSLSADQNYDFAQYYLGLLYFNGNHITRDINRAIYFFTLSANQNNCDAQFMLGIIYSRGLYVEKDIQKSVYYYIQSSKNGNEKSHFPAGYFYHQGKYMHRDIDKMMYYYKKASTLNDQYAKNNLGIIYKNGIKDEFKCRIGTAISYFEEAIQRFNDKVSMYNLSHLYIYEDTSHERINKSLSYLLNSYRQKFYPALELLYIALYKKFDYIAKQKRNSNFDLIYQKYGSKFSIIKKKYIKITKISSNSPLLCFKINNETDFHNFYQYFKTIDYIYDFQYNTLVSKTLFEQEPVKPKNDKIKDITSVFYEGFGLDV